MNMLPLTVSARGNRGLFLVDVVDPAASADVDNSTTPSDGSSGFHPIPWFPKLPHDARFGVFSKSGRYFTYHTANGIVLYDVQTGSPLPLADKVERTERYHRAAFSPNDSYLITWDMPSLKEQAYCRIFQLATLECIGAFLQYKRPEWTLQWSSDEDLLGRQSNRELLFHERGQFRSVGKQCSVPDVKEYSISPGAAPHHVALFHLSANQQGFVRLYPYPNLEKAQYAVAGRAVTNQDFVSFAWNRKGSHVLVSAWNEVDKTGKSYYGSRQLMLLSTAGESAMLHLGKEGPVHSTAWSPNSDMICLTYGFMPNQVSLFNLQGEEIFSFKTNGYTSGSLFNPFGNLLCIFGSGNVPPILTFWDVSNAPKGIKLLTKPPIDVPDMTYLEFAPDGVHVLTATTSPRLRVNNVFRVMHFGGRVLAECRYEKELYQANFRPMPNATAPDVQREFRMARARNKQSSSVAASSAADGDASAATGTREPSAAPPKRPAAYVPPHLRSRGLTGAAPKPLAVHDNATTATASMPSTATAAAASLPVGMTAPAQRKKRGKKTKTPAPE